MPKIRRIRVANIILDNGLKIIGDKIWNTEGNNTLFLLENGGGKTSVIQLLHQLVLPNHKIQDRTMVSSVGKAKTINIAAEWIPDSDDLPVIVTGFSFHNYGTKQDNKNNYEYFNYILEYGHNENYQLDNLPFAQDGKVTHIKDLEKMFKDEPGFVVYSSNKMYQEALEQYGIFSAEWESISKVNGAEGGVNAFFDRADKTSTLIERMLIPSFIESTYSDEEERNAIIDAFKEYKDNLLKLPELERNIEDFEVVNKRADYIIDATEKYGVLKKKLDATKQGFTRLYNTLKRNVDDNSSAITMLNKDIEDIERLSNELKWKIDSYEVFVVEKEIEEKGIKLSEAEDEKRRLEEELESYRRQLIDQEAARAFGKYEEYQKKISSIKAKLQAAEMKADEKLREYQKALDIASGANKFFVLEEQKKVDNLRTENQTVQQNVLDIGKEQKRLNEKTSQLMQEKGSLSGFVTGYDVDKQKLRREIGERWSDSSKKMESEYDVAISKNEEKVDNVNARINNLELEKESYNAKKYELQSAIKEIQVKKVQAEDNLDEFSKVEMKLTDEILRQLALGYGPTKDRDTIKSKIVSNSERFEADHIRSSIRFEELNVFRTAIEQRGFHINGEIEKVIEYLTEKGIYVQAGLEWLISVGYPEEKKKELLKNNPLLNFSILIEDEQEQDINRALALYREKLTIPVFFLAKKMLESTEGTKDFSNIYSNVYMYHKFETRVSTDDWKKYLSNIVESMDEESKRTKDVKARIGQLRQLENQLESFWNQYPETAKMDLEATIEEVENEELDLLTKQKDNVFGLQEIETRLSEEKLKKEALLKEISVLQREYRQVLDFIDRYKDIESKNQRLIFVEQELNNNNLVRDKNDNLLTEYKVKQSNITDKITNARVVLEGYKGEKKSNELKDEVEPVALPQEEYYHRLSLLKELSKEASSEVSVINNLTETLETYSKELVDSQKEVESKGYDVETFKSQGIVFDERLLVQFEDDVAASEEDQRDAAATYDKVNGELRGLVGSYKARLETLNKKYGEVVEEGYFEYSSDYEEELANYQSELADLEEKEKEKRRTVAGKVKLNQTYKEVIEEYGESESIYLVELAEGEEFLDDKEWEPSKPRKKYKELLNGIRDGSDDIGKQNLKIEKEVITLKEKIQETKNLSLMSMANDLIDVIKTSKNDYENMLKSFYDLLKTSEAQKDDLEFRKKESEKGRDELIQMMYDRAEMLYRNTLEISKASQIEDEGKITSLFKITWPKKDEEDAKRTITKYVNEVLHTLVDNKKNGSTDDQLNEQFAKAVSEVRILDCFAELSKCQLRTFKPRSAGLVGGQNYFLWDEVSGWSGGEKHAARMAMYITVSSLARKKRNAQEKSWKFLVADNPFGPASSNHVVKPMVELARKTNTQLFCLTGIEDKKIQREFETVISNKYVQQRGKMHLRSTEDVKVFNDNSNLQILAYMK